MLSKQELLIGGLEHVLFSPIVGMMIQSDELIFFRGWLNHQEDWIDNYLVLSPSHRKSSQQDLHMFAPMNLHYRLLLGGPVRICQIRG